MSHKLMCRTYALLALALTLWSQPREETSKQAFARVSKALLLQFKDHDLVALGESHNTQEDEDIRINLVRDPQFSKTVRNIVVECGNALHQDVLDRFVAGATVPREELQRIWRDTTQSPVGGGDTPTCERLLTEVRSINRNLPEGLKLRVLAGDPPINWATLNSIEQFQGFLRTRDQFAADLVLREVIGKKQKALLVYGAGHLWRNVTLSPVPNLASLIDRSKPGVLFTVVRVGGIYPNTALIESAMPKSRPSFTALKGTPAADLDANELLGRGIPVKLFATGLGIGQVADGCIYTGQRTDTAIASNTPDPAYEKEKERRREFMPRPRRQQE